MQLHKMKIGAKAKVSHLHDFDPAYRKRLIALGLIPGTEIFITRMAPFGDPIEIIVRGFSLTLRKMEASLLEVEAV